MSRTIARVCVYCASSTQCDPSYHAAARRVGEVLAGAGVTVVYGGGAVGSMGALADGALDAGGEVHGIIPEFMYDLEWAHEGITELEVVEDMHLRKRRMISEVDAVVALPGGSGTFEELLEAITWKRLGLYFRPIVLLNTRGYWNALLRALEQAVDQNFMGSHHASMWTVVDEPDDVLEAIETAPPWDEDARDTAVV
jgi:uncharacterized protein (TIGR00730 family)